MSSEKSLPHFGSLFLPVLLSVFLLLNDNKCSLAHEDTLLNEMEPLKEEDASEYLSKFGYTAPSQLNVKTDGMAGDLSNVFDTAVKAFQKFAHLPVTGVLDVKTRKKMAEPRCGMQDGVEMLTEGAGSTAAFKWRKNDLTYTFHNFSPDLPKSSSREAIRKAFAIWGAVTPLNFREVPSSEQADINIKFASGMHDDPWPFDKKGGVLAHATMPTSGMLHFDEAENWVYMDAEKIKTHKYTDLFPVAIHEGGHALGLSHSKAEESIMAPFYQEQVDKQGNYIYPELKPDDIRAIQAIYGPRIGGRVNQQQQEGTEEEEEQQRKTDHHPQNAPFDRGETGDARTRTEDEHGGRGGHAREEERRRHQQQREEEEGPSLGQLLVHKGKKALKTMFINWLNNRR